MGSWGEPVRSVVLLERIQTGLRVEVNYPTLERAVHRVQTLKGRAWAGESEDTQSPVC